MPDDQEQQVRRPVVGVGVVVLSGPRALLIRRGKWPRKGEWSLPGGRQEWGETVAETARRELFEETGLAPGPLHFLDVVDGIGRKHGAVAVHYTLIDFWTELPEAEAARARPGDDADEVRWAEMAEIDGLVGWEVTRRVYRLAFERRRQQEHRP